MRKQHEVIAHRVETEALTGTCVQYCDGLRLLEEPVQFGIDGPGEPARFSRAKVGALRNRISRPQQSVVAGEPSEIEEPVDFKDEILGGKGFPEGAEHDLAGLPARWTAVLLIKGLEQPAEKLEGRSVAVAEKLGPVIQLGAELRRVPAGRHHTGKRIRRGADLAIGNGSVDRPDAKEIAGLALQIINALRIVGGIGGDAARECIRHIRGSLAVLRLTLGGVACVECSGW